MTVNFNKIVSGFSLSHVWILDGSTKFEDAVAGTITAAYRDIAGARNGTLALNSASFDNTGEDRILDTYNSIDNATLTVEAGYLSFENLALLSGETVSSSGTVPNDIYTIDPWTEDSVNTSAHPVVVAMRSKNASTSHTARGLLLGLYSCEFAPVSFTGPSYRGGFSVNLTGKAYLSDYNEVGVALAKKSILKVIGTVA